MPPLIGVECLAAWPIRLHTHIVVTSISHDLPNIVDFAYVVHNRDQHLTRMESLARSATIPAALSASLLDGPVQLEKLSANDRPLAPGRASPVRVLEPPSYKDGASSLSHCQRCRVPPWRCLCLKNIPV